MRHAPADVDALKELMTVGCGAALTTLCRMCGPTPWRLGVVELWPVARLQTPDSDLADQGACVSVPIGGTFGGVFLLCLDRMSARALTRVLLGNSAGDDENKAMSDSALSETGNIVACAFAVAAQKMFGGVIAPSVPQLLVGEQAGNALAAAKPGGAVDVLAAAFIADQHDIKGTFLWTLDAGAHSGLSKTLERAR